MLKFGLNITNNESVQCVNILGILDHVIVNWDTKKHTQTAILPWKVIKSLIIPKPLDVHCWNLDTMRVLINTLCKPSLRASGYETKILQAKSGEKEDDFEPIYLGNYQYWWKMVCYFWAQYQLPFFWLCSFTPTWILFFFFFFFFYYSSPAIYF